MEVKKCKLCETEKSVKLFNKMKTGKQGVQSYCKDCEKDYKLKKRYKIDPTVFYRLYHAQQGCCVICATHTDLHLDHCHESGKVRGLLCSNCNTGLGLFTDSPEKLTSAIKYLGDANGDSDDNTEG